MSNEIKNAITIPAWNLDRLDAKVKQLNKRAAKLGLAPFSYTKELRSIADPSINITTYIGPIPRIEVADITFHGEGPKVNGWKFVGSLDHVTFPEDVLVKTVPGEVIPEQYFHADANCDHCNNIRRRRDTFVIQNEETGEYKQIGRQCSKDYIGHDPENIARLLSSFWSFVNTAEDSMGYGSGSYTPEYDPREVLQLTIRSIKLYGWLSRSAASENQTASVSRIMYLLTKPLPKMVDEWRKEWARFDSVKDLDAENAEIDAAIAWLDQQEANNEYMHNLKAIAKMKNIPMRLFGFWTSLVAAYQRAQDRLEKAKRELKVSAYVGTVKDRMDMTVTVKRMSGFSSHYGWVTVVNMVKDTGETIVWMANTDPKMYIGDKYVITATIKKHEEYKDWKQTHVSRVKIVEKLESKD